MRLAHTLRFPWLCAGLAGILLAPAGLAQLADMERLTGSLGPTQTARLGDVNGDGLIDLVVLSDEDAPGQVGLLRASGPASYGFVETLIPGDSGVTREHLLLDDIDGDGSLDFWVAEQAGSNGVLVGYLNDGTGAFSAAFAFPGPSFVRSIERRDVDGDGLPDLHVSAFFGSGFLRAQPGGALLGLQTYFPAGVQADASILLDSDGDGDLDLLSLSAVDPASGLVRTMLFENTGTFPLDPAAGVLVDPLSPGVRGFEADVDGDGDVDAVIQRTFLGQIDLFENVGGSLSATQTLAGPFVGTVQFSVGDITGNGSPDLLWANAGQLTYRENLGPLGFGPPTNLGASPVLPQSGVDLDQDGLTDFLFLNSNSATTQLFLRYGELSGGALTLGAGRLRFTDTTGRVDPVVFDANGDGLDDLILVEENTRLVWRRALGAGLYAISTDIAPLPPGTAMTAGGDFDGDGHGDVAYAGADAPELVLLAGDGAGGFSETPNPAALPSQPTGLLTADLNQDGSDDLIITRAGSTAVGVLLGGSGVWGPLINVGGNFGQPVTPVPIDANADGLLDLAFSAGQVIELALQTPAGTFPSRTVVVDASSLLNGGSLPPALAGDVDQDGIADLVVQVLGITRWARGTGAGSFGSLEELLSSAPGTAPLRFLRIDPDGQPDLALSTPGSIATLLPAWSPGLGGSTFGAPQGVQGSILTGSLGPRSFVPVDVDGDGDLDLLSRTIRDAHIVTYNLANGELGAPYCGPAVPNSSGSPASLSATGSASLGANQLRLAASGLPTDQFGFFVNSQVQDLVTVVPNSVGTLCLGGAVGRFNRAGEILQSGAEGAFQLNVDLSAIPTPNGEVSVLPGQTWNFQAWFRDATPSGGPTSNFTDGLAVTY